MAHAPNTAAHIIDELGASQQHDVVQRWIALAPGGKGQFDLPSTMMVVKERKPKFQLLDQLTGDAGEFDWVFLCDDDVEFSTGFLDRFIGLAERYDFALCQPARTVDSFTDHPIVQVLPGLTARQTNFVEIGPVVCIRRDAARLLMPFGPAAGMGWGLDFVWPRIIARAGLRLGIIDATPVSHRIRPPAVSYDSGKAHQEMSLLMARHEYLTKDEAFTILEAYA
ncbi:MAG: hypothetical protein KGK02_04375 [Rhodospirillales bacterium]|nr:hypothetical protein [Rhodospirillales bacterium]